MPLETKLNVWKGKRYVWMLAKGPACVSNTNVKFRSLTLERVKAFFGTACIKDIVTTIRKRRLEKDVDFNLKKEEEMKKQQNIYPKKKKK